MRHALPHASPVLATTLILLSALGAGPGRAADAGAEASRAYHLGEWHLTREHPQPALRAAAACEAVAPGRPACRSLLGRALAMRGRCREAVAVFVGLRGTRAWGARDALAEGSCRAELGDGPGAEASWAEAEALSGGGEATAQAVAWARAMADLPRQEGAPWTERERALREVRGRLPGHQMWLADATGRLDPDLRAWLRCEAALAHDDPWAAAGEVGHGVSRGEAWRRGLVCRAEARRRLGEPEVALEMGRNGVVDSAWAPLRMVVVRALVDVGRIGEARTRLATPPIDREGLASTWYVAQAEGRQALAASLQGRWQARFGPQTPSLDTLRPRAVGR